MTTLYRGHEQREARSPYLINSLKAQGFTETPAPVATPEPKTTKRKNKKRKRGGITS